jgi:putative methionine-R-sulfoxide reductase with GAF domain
VILGQVDVDSDVPGLFPAGEVAEVRKVAEALAVLL